MYIHSLGKNLALNLFVYNKGNSKLGTTVDSFRFAMLTFGGAFLFEQCPVPGGLRDHLSCGFASM